MSPDQVINLTRRMLEITLMTCAPMLAVGIAIGLIVSVFQAVTSVSDTTISTVPRLAAVGATAFLLSPWMFRHMVAYTIRLLGDLHPYLH